MKIAITGPESAGKTTLAKNLSEAFGLTYIEEYSREYLASKKDFKYEVSDLLNIAREQYKRIDEAENAISDTEMTVMKIWLKDKFHIESFEINTLWETELIDLYFLCKPDIPWEPDPLREDPFRRDELFLTYEDLLKSKGANYYIIKGSDRTEQAISILSKFIKNST